MDNQNLPEHTGIKNIVSKIIRTRKLSTLSCEEIAVLSEFAGIKTDTTKERKTLLSWIWDKMIRYTFYIDQNLIDISVLNNIILNPARYYGRNIDEAFWKIMSRDDLKNLINEAFRLKESADRMNNEKITGGLLLIGLTGMHEYENRIAEICLNEKGGSIDIFYEADYIFASLVSLLMLESPKVHEIALRLHDATEEKIRTALMIYYNLFPERLNEDEIFAYKEFLKADRDIALRLPDFTFRVFQDDINGLNNLFNDKFYNDPEEIWNSLCPAIFRFTNKKLLKKILDTGNEEVIIRILLYAVYKKEDWILPLLKEKLDESNQKDADDPWARLNINVFLSMVADFLGKGHADLMQGDLISKSDFYKAAAVFSAIGKERYQDDLNILRRSTDKIISVCAEFAWSSGCGKDTVYLSSLVAEMKFSEVPLDFFPFLHCMISGTTKEYIPELKHSWLMYGPFDHREAIEFFNLYPYRLVSSFQNSYSAKSYILGYNSDLLERSLTVLKSVSDNRMNGFLKTLLYKVSDEAARGIILSVLLDLEQESISAETRTLKKIFSSNTDEQIDFEEDEYPYALMFYYFGDNNPKIVRGLKKSTSFNESFLRMIIETSCNEDLINAAFDSAASLNDVNDNIISRIIELKEGKKEDIDQLTLARYLNCGSERIRYGLINRYFPRNGDNTGAAVTDNDLQMLFFLFSESSNDLLKVIAEALAVNISQAEWFSETVDRWLALSYSNQTFGGPLREGAYKAASLIKSERYLPVFIKLLKPEDSGKYHSNSDLLDIVGDLISANTGSRFLLLRADDPQKVEKMYNLKEKREFRFGDDEKLQCVNLLSKALTSRADADYAKANMGKAVSINHENDHLEPELIENCLTRTEFEKIAVYLTVTYADDASGLIFAEVSDPEKKQPSGEIVNALLQKLNFAIFTVSWC